MLSKPIKTTMKLTKKEKQQLVSEALRVILTHAPCYGKREEDPCFIEIGNGVILRNKDGWFLTAGHDNVAKVLVSRYGDNTKIVNQ